MLILVWDGANDAHDADQRTPMVFFGAMVKEGASYNTKIDHYATLGLLLDMHGLPRIGNTRNAPKIEEIWK